MKRSAITSCRKIVPGTIRLYRPGESLSCMVLADGPAEWAGVDLASGALVRARAGGLPDDGGGRLLDVVEVTLGDDREPPDPCRPEAISVVGSARVLGRLRARQARRMLDELLSERQKSESQPLLGVVGPSAAYGDMDGSSPSLELVRPSKGPELVAAGGSVWCTFTLGGANERLPVLDRRAASVANALAGTVLTRAGTAAMLEFEPQYMLVGFVPPRSTHTPKAVLSMIPRP